MTNQTLSQHCRCGGRGKVLPAFSIEGGKSQVIGYAAVCGFCGASTVTYFAAGDAILAWHRRDCPNTTIIEVSRWSH